MPGALPRGAAAGMSETLDGALEEESLIHKPPALDVASIHHSGISKITRDV